MTTQKVIATIFAYLIALFAAIYFTPVAGRRIAGALAGGAPAGWMLLEAVALGNGQGWGRVLLPVAAVIGPPRDYLIAGIFPEWMVFAPGVAPILSDAAAYAGFVGSGHGVMRLAARPARKDQTR